MASTDVIHPLSNQNDSFLGTQNIRELNNKELMPFGLIWILHTLSLSNVEHNTALVGTIKEMFKLRIAELALVDPYTP